MILAEAYQRHVTEQGGARFLFILGASVASSKQDIVYAREEYVRQGFEGVIIRKVGGVTETQQKESYYKGTRCTAIYKNKTTKDDEGFIIGAKAANGGYSDGGVVWHVRDKMGRDFEVNPEGDVEVRKIIYQQFVANPQQFMGLKYRYKYQELTPMASPDSRLGWDLYSIDRLRAGRFSL